MLINLIGSFISKKWKQITWLDIFEEHRAWFDELQKKQEKEEKTLTAGQAELLSMLKLRQEKDRLEKLARARKRVENSKKNG